MSYILDFVKEIAWAFRITFRLYWSVPATAKMWVKAGVGMERNGMT
jgi:hypothetical protein